MRQACILDLDGTLMPSHAVDNDCYWEAVRDVFAIEQPTISLDGFRHVSDEGILEEWSERTLGRTATANERATLKARFLELIDAAAEQDPEAFHPFPGVRAWLEARPAGSTAVATGGWSHTARRKLELAGLDDLNLPLASCDDDHRRVAIMQHAHGLLGAPHQDSRPTYFGDGPWDLAASQSLDWGFIGIATGARAEALRDAGALAVHEDFRALVI